MHVCPQVMPPKGREKQSRRKGKQAEHARPRPDGRSAPAASAPGQKRKAGAGGERQEMAKGVVASLAAGSSSEAAAKAAVRRAAATRRAERYGARPDVQRATGGASEADGPKYRWIDVDDHTFTERAESYD